jgi:hypothetical protein
VVGKARAHRFIHKDGPQRIGAAHAVRVQGCAPDLVKARSGRRAPSQRDVMMARLYDGQVRWCGGSVCEELGGRQRACAGY